MSKLSFILILQLFFIDAVFARVEGRVVAEDGHPIEHAYVEVVEAVEAAEAEGREHRVYSDSAGRFRLLEVEAPVELKIGHSRFRETTIQVGLGDSPVEIVLESKQEIYEEIAVSATRGERNYAPVSIATHVIRPEDSAAPQTLTEMVAEVPGVSENGQGGIFQTYSIRGVARQRVLTLVAGMRIVSERRAGVSASFVEPGLMGSVDVLKGPSSTYYGSGALGGVVQLFPRQFDQPTFETGYDSQGDARRVLLAGGGEGWSLGLAHRESADTETPAGLVLNSAFEQTSASFSKTWNQSERTYRLIGLASRGDDIGKANTDFPERTTVYPEENHLLLRFSVERAESWRFEAWVHPNDLETLVTEGAEENLVQNQAFDLGLNWQGQRKGTDNLSLRYGADYFGRRSVTADEVTRIEDVEVLSQRTLEDGTEDELGLYGVVEWSWHKAVILAGGRAAFQRQENARLGSRDETAVTAFVGLVLPLRSGFEWVGNVGTGLRFASLSERFFTGTTGRGFVVGNPRLEPESALNADVGLRWYGNRLFLSGYLFRNAVDDYIERVETEPGRLTFVNLTAGDIEGAELEGAYRLKPDWSLSFGGHAIEGRADGGGPLADVPADGVFLGVSGTRGRWSWQNRWEHRFEKSDPGSGEKLTAGADLLTASIGYELRSGFSVTFSGRNLLDEEYFPSADRRVPLAAGRSMGIALSWQPPADGS